MNYYEQIDPIGESSIDPAGEALDKEHDLICNVGTDLHRIRQELQMFKEAIDDFETYSENLLFINKLKNQYRRLLDLNKNLNTNFDKYVDFHAK